MSLPQGDYEMSVVMQIGQNAILCSNAPRLVIPP
jgi:hypothetical protein